MAIDTKIEEYAFPEDSLPGSADDVNAFFAAERARKDKVYKDKMLSERVELGAVPAEKKGTEAKPKYKSFSVINAPTYAKGIEAVGKENAFSFEQNIEARLADYEAHGENAILFNTYLDSVTGVAYKAHSTKFKVKPVCEQLKSIKPNFNKSFMPVDYDSFEGIELDSADPNVKYGQSLTREEAKAHKGWLVVMNGNKDLLAKYVDTWFDKTGRDKGMGFYVMQNTSEDQLRSVILYYDLNYSLAGGLSNFLYNFARFVSGAQ
jgi:hypothetical protein